jgi:hypothetical protein
VKHARQADPQDGQSESNVVNPEGEDLGQRDYEEWWKEYLAEIVEGNPVDWWEYQLRSAADPELLKRSVKELVTAGCRLPDLLAAIRTVKFRYEDPPYRRAIYLEQSKLFADLADFYPLVFGYRFTLKDWEVMRDLMTRYADLLSQEATRFKKRSPNARRLEAVTELLELVDRDTRKPRHPLVSELLCTFVDPSLTEANLRKIASRADIPKRRASKPKAPVRRPSKAGRKVRLSARTMGKRYRLAKAMAGLEDWDEDS